jgi:hypothetical protein
MIEIPRVISRFGATGVFRGVLGLNGNDKVMGYVQQWYFEGKERDRNWGIRIEDEEKLDYAEIVAKAYGIPLGQVNPYGMVNEELFYELYSFLVNGTIVTSERRRKTFGRPEVKSIHEIAVNERMPLRLLKIVAETKEKVLETAHMASLPLEKLAAA